MSVRLLWATQPLASCFHAADLILRGRTLADADLAAALAEPLRKLKTVLASDQFPSGIFLDHVIPICGGMTGSLELARTVVAKMAGPEEAERRKHRYSELLLDIETAFRSQQARLDQQMPVRPEAVKEPWTINGQLLLNSIGELTEKQALVEEAQVLLVHPLSGGGGVPYPRYNVMVMETVTPDPLPSLPEVVRLAWLVAAQNLDLPRYTDKSPNLLRTVTIGVRAFIPVTLNAAEQCGLLKYDKETLTLALRNWLPTPEDDLVDKLQQWWEVYSDTRPKWYMALAALEKMMK